MKFNLAISTVLFNKHFNKVLIKIKDSTHQKRKIAFYRKMVISWRKTRIRRIAH